MGTSYRISALSGRGTFAFPSAPTAMTFEWERSPEGQRIIQVDNLQLATAPISAKQRFLVSPIHIRSFLRGWFGAIDATVDCEKSWRPPVLSKRRKGRRPSSYGQGFSRCVKQMERDGPFADVCKTPGYTDHEPYNDLVRFLRRSYPDEFLPLGFYDELTLTSQGGSDMAIAFSPRHFPKSNWIEWIRYAPEQRILEIAIKGREKVSRKWEVPAALYDSFCNAPSAGAFWHAHVDRQFDGTEVDREIFVPDEGPVQAAAPSPIVHGAWITRCIACGRALTDPESQRRGIGPECAQAADLSRRGVDVNLHQGQFLRAARLPEPDWRIRLKYGEPFREGAFVPFAELLLYRWDRGERVAIIVCQAHKHRGNSARTAFAELVHAAMAFQELLAESGPTRFFLVESYSDVSYVEGKISPEHPELPDGFEFRHWDLIKLSERLAPKGEAA
jgi:uncharacterized protein DUF6011/KTSC domain-containing protein